MRNFETSNTWLDALPHHLRTHPRAHSHSRRGFLAAMGFAGAFFSQRGAFAQALTQTPEQTIGPYYPDKLPLDQDNDLLIINDAITPALGVVSWVTGRVLDSSGQPLRGALVEIWQADNGGAYIHSASPITPRDSNFQGYGKFQTGSDGRYLFRTIKPGLYPGRTRHIHFAITPAGRTRFTTQLYVQGESMNSNDGILNGIRDTSQRASVVLPWAAVPESRTGDLAVNFDIVMGFTPSGTAAQTRPTLVSMSGVVDAASSAAGAAPGAWVTLFGDRLSNTTRTWQSADFVGKRLPETLDGVSVRLNNKAAAVYYVSPNQINVLAPADAATGTVQATVTNANGTSDPVTVSVQPLMPGFFLFAQDYVAAIRADGAYLGPTSLIPGLTTVAAKPGDKVMLFGAGFGDTIPAPPAGETFQGAYPLANKAAIRIDTVEPELTFAGLISPGVYQFNFTVPDLPDGDHAVTARVGPTRTARIGRLRIQR